jgi:hypothetical protein
MPNRSLKLMAQKEDDQEMKMARIASRRVKDVILQQKKQQIRYFDTQVSAGINSSASVNPLALPVQGSGVTNRMADVIYVTEIELRYEWYLLSTGDFSNTCRTMIVVDRQPNGSGFAGTDLFQSTSTNSEVVSPLNFQNRNRFKILYDKTIELSLNGPATAHRTWKYQFQTPHRISYTGNSGTVTDLISNSLNLVIVTDSTATPSPDLETICRVYFYDE